MQPYQESSLLKLSNSTMIDLIDWMAQNLYEPQIEDIASMKIQFKSQ